MRREAPGPSIDVVIPVWGHVEYVEQAIRSAVQAGFAQVLVHDDGTCSAVLDRMLDELERELTPVSVSRVTRNRGISASQNTLVERSSAEYIAFLDCDDYLSPTTGVQVQRALATRETDYLFTDRADVCTRWVDGQEDETSQDERRFGGFNNKRFDKPWEFLLLDGMFASHLKVIRREFIQSVGGFDSRADGLQDWEFALRASRQGVLSHLPEVLYYHRIHAGQESSRSTISHFPEVNRLRREHLRLLAGSEARAGRRPVQRFSEAARSDRRFRLMVDGLAPHDFVAIRLDDTEWRFHPAHANLAAFVEQHRPEEFVFFGSAHINRDLLQTLRMKVPAAAFGVTAWSTGLSRERVLGLRWENSYFDFLFTNAPDRLDAIRPYCHPELDLVAC